MAGQLGTCAHVRVRVRELVWVCEFVCVRKRVRALVYYAPCWRATLGACCALDACAMHRLSRRAHSP